MVSVSVLCTVTAVAVDPLTVRTASGAVCAKTLDGPLANGTSRASHDTSTTNLIRLFARLIAPTSPDLDSLRSVYPFPHTT
jgi:hypothetical protein